VPLEAPALCSSWTTIAVELVAVDALGSNLGRTARSLADASVLVVILDELVILSEPKGNCWKSFCTCGRAYKLGGLKRNRRRWRNDTRINKLWNVIISFDRNSMPWQWNVGAWVGIRAACIGLLEKLIGKEACKVAHSDILPRVSFWQACPESKPAVTGIDSNQGCVEPKPSIHGNPKLLQTQMILTHLVGKVDTVACFKVGSKNLRSEDVPLLLIPIFIVVACLVCNTRLGAASILGGNKKENLLLVVLVTNCKQLATLKHYIGSTRPTFHEIINAFLGEKGAAVLDNTNKLMSSVSYFICNLDRAKERITIGMTWLRTKEKYK